jgi:hypothetical protein
MNEIKNLINPNALPNMECKNCDSSTLFDLKYRLKKVSRLVAPNGQEGFICIPVYVCSHCGTELNMNTNEKTIN